MHGAEGEGFTEWMSRTLHPEATMLNAYLSFKVACLVLTDLAAQQLLHDEEGEGHSTQSPLQGCSITCTPLT